MKDEQRTSPLKAIKQYCRTQCCCDDMDSWKNCQIEDCQLHPFRLGKNPFRKKRKMTDEQRKKIANRLAKAREAKSE